MTTYDKNGTWVTRPDPDCPGECLINLCADANHMVPLCMGMRLDGMMIKETRMYSIAEIRKRVQAEDRRRVGME
jgi:hypothetical protein